MKNTFIILLIAFIIVALVIYLFYLPKVVDDKWNNKCITSGGVVVESGKSCEYSNCDKTKYPCLWPY